MNINIIIQNYNSYIDNLSIPDKQKSILLEKNQIQKNPLFYLGYASLFGDCFDFPNKEKKITLLNIAGFFCYKFSLLLDNHLDSKSKDSRFDVKITMLYLEEFMKILASLFKLNENYWHYYNLRKFEFYNAAKIADSLYIKDDVSIKEFEDLSDQKSALGKLAIDSLSILGKIDNRYVYNELLLSHKYFSIGFQITDDISDVKEDFENNQFNYAFYFYNKNFPKINNIDNLHKHIYIDGVAIELYRLAISYFNKSLRIAKNMDLKKWEKVIENKIIEGENAIESINEYLLLLRTKDRLKKEATKINHSLIVFDKPSKIEKGLLYIIKQWEKDFPEIKHVMVLSKREGFNNTQEVHVTDIFQRAILTDNLIEINNKNLELSFIIDSEIKYLIGKKNLDENGGGWSYFPSVKEIAPDADDLGQIMQVLTKSNNKDLISKHCINEIKILINDCKTELGGIKTWIIPSKNRNKTQLIQNEFNLEKWGEGPDIDVMSNFLYSLALFDYHKYSKVIEKGISYIVERINPDFFWKSRWYFGWLYGTMVSLKLIVEAMKRDIKLKRKYNSILKKVYDKILKEQNKDGGWGIDFNNKSDPLNTSFALECIDMLSFFLFSSKSQNSMKGIKFLKGSQNLDGSWDAVDFITPRVGGSYKSKTITTSYVLKSICSYEFN